MGKRPTPRRTATARRQTPIAPRRTASLEHGPRPLAARDQRRFDRLRELCCSLPEVSCEPYGERHAAFKVRKKSFAYFLNHHHDDGKISLCAKAAPGRQQELVKAHPQRYYVPAYLGPSGWVSLRLDLPQLEWDEVFERVVEAYRLLAPRRLAEGMS